MSDYAAMNEVYAAMLPTPKPARTAVEVGKLPGAFLIEIEAIAAIPEKRRFLDRAKCVKGGRRKSR